MASISIVFIQTLQSECGVILREPDMYMSPHPLSTVLMLYRM